MHCYNTNLVSDSFCVKKKNNNKATVWCLPTRWLNENISRAESAQEYNKTFLNHLLQNIYLDRYQIISKDTRKTFCKATFPGQPAQRMPQINLRLWPGPHTLINRCFQAAITGFLDVSATLGHIHLPDGPPTHQGECTPRTTLSSNGAAPCRLSMSNMK